MAPHTIEGGGAVRRSFTEDATCRKVTARSPADRGVGKAGQSARKRLTRKAPFQHVKGRKRTQHHPHRSLPRRHRGKAGRRVVSVSAHALPAFVLLVLALLLVSPVGSDDRSDLEILQERVTFLELRGAELARTGETMEQRLETLTKAIQSNTHNHMYQEAKICDSVVALNQNLGIAFDNDRLLDMAQEQERTCLRIYEQAAEYRATRPFIRMTEWE